MTSGAGHGHDVTDVVAVAGRGYVRVTSEFGCLGGAVHGCVAGIEVDRVEMRSTSDETKRFLESATKTARKALNH